MRSFGLTCKTEVTSVEATSVEVTSVVFRECLLSGTHWLL